GKSGPSITKRAGRTGLQQFASDLENGQYGLRSAVRPDCFSDKCVTFLVPVTSDIALLYSQQIGFEKHLI
ncbi:hypothetical protein CHS0354_010991, partial [Potamilus streckersoni]